MLNKTEYAYVANGGTLGAAADTITYGYESEYQAWADQLTSYDGEAIRYDASGNPTTYRGYTMTWNGRQLATATNGTNTISYSYDENGIRTQKTVNGVVTNYNYHGSALISQVTDNDTLLFSYDTAGNAAAVNYNGTYYYYVRNGQNDIIRLIDGDNNTVVEYAYDSWGTPLSTTGTLASTLGAQNPFRDRGYVYDAETGLYYVISRYYDPEIGRGINADNQLSKGSDLTGLNLFAYCGNNPVNRIDPTGEAWWHWALGAAVVAVVAVATVVTCGGFAAAATAVCMVGSGVAAATTASTVAAGAFIGSATVYGMAVLSAASTSSSVQEFNDQGNWGTVAATAGGAILGGGSAYVSTRTPTTKVYRSVSDAEAQDIKATGQFNLAPGGMESKQFGFDLAETRQFGNMVGQNTIVSAKIPTNMLNQFYTGGVDTSIFRGGTLTVYGDQLAAFNQAVGGTIKFMP